MKRISLFLAALLLLQFTAEAQGIQATLVNGTTPNSVRVRIKNNTAAAIVGDLVSFRFSLRIPDQGAGNPTVSATSLMTLPGSITYPPAYTEASYRYYDVSVTLNGSNPVNLAPAAQMDVFNVVFANGAGSANVELVGKLFNGPGSAGPNNATEYYVATNTGDVTDYNSRFYSNGTNSTGLSNSTNISVVGLAGVVLPVKYTHFDAVKEANTSLLNWGTGSEKNNQGFDIERSLDGKSFTKIGFQRSLAGNGTSNENLEYRFSDLKPAAGVNYYRLKQTDIDGKSEYSKIVSVLFDQSGAIKVYPNPATGKVTVEAAGVKSIEVYNITGQRADVPVTYGTVSHQLNVSGLAEGNYTVRISTATGVTTQKLVRQH